MSGSFYVPMRARLELAELHRAVKALVLEADMKPGLNNLTALESASAIAKVLVDVAAEMSTNAARVEHSKPRITYFADECHAAFASIRDGVRPTYVLKGI
jgi:hypothetical protein